MPAGAITISSPIIINKRKRKEQRQKNTILRLSSEISLLENARSSRNK